MADNSQEAPKKKRRGPGRPFVKGGPSPNPGGRPKVAEEFKLSARRAVDEHVLSLWVGEIVNRGDQRMKASELLVAYGYGKPASAESDLEAAREGLTVIIKRLAGAEGGGE